MGFTDLVSPVASADRDNRQLGENDSASEGSGHLGEKLSDNVSIPFTPPSYR